MGPFTGNADYAVVSSSDPDPIAAGAEVAGGLLERIDQAPSLAIVLISGRHRARWDELGRLMAEIVQPDRLICVEVDRFFTGSTAGMADDATAALVLRTCEELEPVALGSAEATTAMESTDQQVPLVLATTEGGVARAIEIDRPGGQSVIVASTSAGVGRMTIDGSPARLGLALVHTAGSDPLPVLGLQGVVPASPVFAVTSADRDRLRSVAGRPVRSVTDEVIAAEEAKGHTIGLKNLMVGAVVGEGAVGDEIESLRMISIVGTATVSGDLVLAEPVEVGSLIRFVVNSSDSLRLDAEVTAWAEASRPAVLLAFAEVGAHLWLESGASSTLDTHWDPIALVGEDVPALGLMVPRCHGPLGPGAPRRPSGWLHRGVGYVGLK